MSSLKLSECDVCSAVVPRDAKAEHAQWHVKLEARIGDEFERLRGIEAEFERAKAKTICGDGHGQWKCNIQAGHEGRHMAATNGFVLGAWSETQR